MTSPHQRPSGFRCASTGRVTAALLLSFLALSPSPVTAANNARDLSDDIVLPPGPIVPLKPESPAPAEHTFSLRHIFHHGTYEHPGLHRRKDISRDNTKIFLAAEGGYGEQEILNLKAKSRASTMERMVDRRPSVVDPIVAMSRRQGYAAVLGASAWTMDEVPSPDITDKETVLTMARMTADAYVANQTDADWQDVGLHFNRSADFGWESDGLRGHIFADETNSTIVIGLKGTSMAVFDGEGTTTNDKENDNLFFSCCCAQQGQWTWHQVCNCATDTYTCNNTCVAEALQGEHRYYTAARELYSNVTELYPNANVWLTGHSLGGAVTSLLGLTYGLPVVTFEAVPDALPATRLGLPVPPGADPRFPQVRENTGAYHFGHTADPVYIGTCNGATASCSFAGYAMESTCHSGYECVYDVVADKGWRVGIGTHRIRSVIDDIILKYDDVPQCQRTPDCRDCAQWKMYESHGTDSTTSTSIATTKTRTRTATCRTPGWWGCLDETTSEPTATTTTTSTTSTCKTPGWFGCNDETTTDATTTESSSTSTTTCATPGRFWGCRDVATTTSAEPSTVTPMPSITDEPLATETAPASSSPPEHKCLHRNWFGFCKQWDVEVDEILPDEM